MQRLPRNSSIFCQVLSLSVLFPYKHSDAAIKPNLAREMGAEVCTLCQTRTFLRTIAEPLAIAS